MSSINKRSDTKETFIEKAKAVYGDKYSYDNLVYTPNSEYVTITCKEHGDFNKPPKSFLYGYGCPLCSPSKGFSKNNLGYFYIHTFTVDGSKYIKYGITNNPDSRFNRFILHNPKISCFENIFLVYGEGSDIFDMERSVKIHFNNGIKYISKTILPDGYTEVIPYEKLQELLTFVSIINIDYYKEKKWQHPLC